jgi:hypothetical protein
MRVKKNPLAMALVVWFFCALPNAGAVKRKQETRKEITATGPAILWNNPADLESRNLFYGPGGSGHVPHGTFTFIKEDLDGTSPKFVVIDEAGVKWKVKMGIEARPETVATRIVWAVGYYTNEDYFVRDLAVVGMPQRLQRGQNLIGADGSVHNVRLKKEGAEGKKIANWRWRHDAFTGTREWNGLRALMAVINNWDLKDENNAVYQEDGKRIYMVSDLGASFASAGRSWPRNRSKGDLNKYRDSKLIRQVTPLTVDFQAPARPRYVYAVNPKEYFSRVHLGWIGRNVPRSDAKWMGQLLARLSQRQIHDAFRAAGYSPQEVDDFSHVLSHRIAQLTDL